MKSLFYNEQNTNQKFDTNKNISIKSIKAFLLSLSLSLSRVIGFFKDFLKKRYKLSFLKVTTFLKKTLWLFQLKQPALSFLDFSSWSKYKLLNKRNIKARFVLFPKKTKSINQLLDSVKGFSILGVLVASSIGLIVTSGLTQMFAHTSSQINQLEKKTQRILLEATMRDAMKIPPYCKATIQPIAGFLMSGIENKELYQIKTKPGGQTLVNLGNKELIKTSYGIEGLSYFYLTCEESDNDCDCSSATLRSPCTKSWSFNLISQSLINGVPTFNRLAKTSIFVTFTGDPDDSYENYSCCQTGEKMDGDACVEITCPSGQSLQGNECMCPAGQVKKSDGSCGCPTGQRMQSGSCVAITCSRYHSLRGNSCVRTSCPSGQRLSGGSCVAITCSRYHSLRGNNCVRTSCPSGQRMQNGACVAITCSRYHSLRGNNCVRTSCPSGQRLSGGSCVAITCSRYHSLRGNSCVRTSCPSGQRLSGGSCVAITCSRYHSLRGNSCVRTSCPSGQRISGGSCVAITCSRYHSLRGNNCVRTSCPSGQRMQNGACVAITCSRYHSLRGNNCVRTSCPSGQRLSGGSCVAITCSRYHSLRGNNCVRTSCPSGQRMQNGACVAITYIQCHSLGGDPVGSNRCWRYERRDGRFIWRGFTNPPNPIDPNTAP